MLIIIATILTLTTPTGSLSPNNCLIYLGMFRILLGVGVGGDYPMSASITSDRSNLRKRGTMLAYVFSNQGWGSLVGSLATLIVLAIYRGAIEKRNELSKVDGGTITLETVKYYCLLSNYLFFYSSLAHRCRNLAHSRIRDALSTCYPPRV
jgi:MFS family permease